jgi:hypothetical protein
LTLPAVDSWNVRGIEGPAYKVGPRCSNPTCGKLADHAHHIIRRSQLVKHYDWIAIDGLVIGNKTGLCASCHDDITGLIGGHKAAIRWIEGAFWWCLLRPPERDEPYLPVGPLTPQPPTPESLATDDPQASDTGAESCPFCGQHRRRRLTPTRVGRRHRKRWTVLVPDEQIEDGADVLDSLIDNLAPLIPHADASATGRYYVVVAALAHALIDSESLMASLQGTNAR